MIDRIKNKIKQLQEDPHLREVARGTLVAFVLKVIGSGLTFGFNVAVARLTGADGAGIYFLALAITTIGSVIGRLGLDNALLRFTSFHAAKSEWGEVKAVHSLGMRIAAIFSMLLTLVGFLLAPWIAISIFNKPELAEPLRWMSLSILPFALLNLQAECLKGLKKVREAMLIQGVGVPLVGLLLIIPMAHISGVLGASLSYILGTMLTAALGYWALRRTMFAHKNVTGYFPIKELWTSCRFLLPVSLMNRAILPWASMFLLGIWASSDEVGIFGAANRVAMLVSFMLATINNVVTPKFTELYAKQEMESLGHLARRSALLITMLASPIFIFLIFGSQDVMSIFGDAFKDGAIPLTILAIGQLVNSYTGSVGYLLIMSGNENVLMRIIFLSALLMCFSLIVLVPAYGMVGAAVSTSLSWIVMNIAASVEVERRIGICPIPFVKWR